MESRTTYLFNELKNKGLYLHTGTLKTFSGNDEIFIRAVSTKMPRIDEFIIKATHARNTWREAFLSEFNASTDRTFRWIKTIENNPFQVLFSVENFKKISFAHIGITFDSIDKTFEIGQIVRFEEGCKGGMTQALLLLCEWTFNNFDVPYIFLKCVAENSKAMAMYQRCGFKETSWIPFFKYRKNDEIIWQPAKPEYGDVEERTVLVMKKYRTV
ncbi:MAG: GNAT family protein [Thermodesulfobacteriota bacterium]